MNYLSKGDALRVGDRIEIPPHFDLWMRGARFGVVTAVRYARVSRESAFKNLYAFVRMDHPQVKRRVSICRMDWEYAKR